MKVIGVTGPIGSGKSTVARLMAIRGARVLDADRVARDLVDPAGKALQLIIEQFGEGIINSDGTLDRRRLGSMVFGDPEKLAILNDIMLPRLTREIRNRLRYMAKTSPEEQLAVIDAALLFEMGLNRASDIIVMVLAEDDIRRKRLLKQGLSPEEAETRIAAQRLLGENAEAADFVLRNEGTVAELRDQVAGLWAKVAPDC